MLWILVSVLLVLAAAAFVLWPYLRPQPSSAGGVDLDPRLIELYSKRDMLYQAVRDARFDQQTGKLSEEDFEQQSARLKHRAATVLRSIDKVEAELTSPRFDQQIETAVAALRQMPSALKTSTGNGAASFAPAAQTAGFCTKCGEQLKAGDRFCGRCGQPAS